MIMMAHFSSHLLFFAIIIKTYQLVGHEDIRLFCNGYYAEILIMDVTTLEVIYSLTSKVNPDWISAMHVLRPAKRQGLL